MKSIRILFVIIYISMHWVTAQTKLDIISSNEDELIIRVNTNITSVEDLKTIELLIGLPNEELPKIKIKVLEKINFNNELRIDDYKTEWIHNQIVNSLHTGTLRISPMLEDGLYSKSMIIKIPFKNNIKNITIPSRSQKTLLSPKIINWSIAQRWLKPNQNSIKKESFLPEGNWIQLTSSKDGVYKLTGNQILDLIEPNLNLEPRSLMLFTSSSLGRDRTFKLTQRISNNPIIPSNLIEIPITIQGESDGNLGTDDIIYFYVQGPSGYDLELNKMNWHQNLYFTESNHWLLIPNDNKLRGKRIETANIIPESSQKLDYGVSYLHFEIDKENPQKSGLGWGETIIKPGGSLSRTINLPSPLSTSISNGSFGMIGNELIDTKYKNTNHSVSISLNGKELTKINWSNLNLNSAAFQVEENLLVDGEQSFKISNNSQNPNSEPLFDYLSISYDRKLDYQNPFEFTSLFKSNNISFKIKGSDLKVWNITNIIKPENIPLLFNDTITSLNTYLPKDSVQRFFTFKLADVPSPKLSSYHREKKWAKLRNRSLGAKHLIIGPQTFFNATAPLVAHRKNTIYVSLNQIYQEFSGGNKDPIAIRHFLQWSTEEWSQKPTTVFLIGDADFDYRNITGRSKIIIPTIEIGTNYSHATDDRFAAFNGTIPELAIGRFPARTEQEVISFTEKIIEYENNLPPGLWKQRITLVADDPARPEREPSELFIGKSHTINSERLAKIIPDFMEVNKLYMVDYPEVMDASTFGVTKPEATKALFNLISSGSAFINFIGHGNSLQWAQEKLLVINNERNDIESINANMKLPIWIAGTCNWGHFDDIDKESFAEELIRAPMNGASAIITTSRGITVSSNIQYLEQIFNMIFIGDSVTHQNIGSILQSVKTGGKDGELFHLFGDPAMLLPIPSNLISNSKILPDTLETLEVGTLFGISPFDSGKGYLIFEDGPSLITKFFNYSSKEEKITYLQNGPTLFKGEFSFSNSTFSPQFRVPKDITYSKNSAKVRFNVVAEDGDEAIGSVSGIKLTLGLPSNDTNGPIITFESESGIRLQNGDNLPENQNLIIRFSDPMGINLTGEKGHELTIKENLSNDIVSTNENFIYDINSLNTGTILYKIPSDLEKISLIVKAWDNANNPSENQIELMVLKSNELSLLSVLNFPNPFSNETQFTFKLTKNADIKIDIYTLSGRKIKSINKFNSKVGYNRIRWDGRDGYGSYLANGVYLYKITAINEKQKINHIGRLAVHR